MARWNVYRGGRRVGTVIAEDYDGAKDSALAQFGSSVKVRPQ